ncbi:MAG: hypothetical protein RIA69_08585 [Cyclobacteriaceae bacterium]
MTELYQELVKKLSQLFGRFDSDKQRFQDATNSKISRELGYSDSQFSRLIHGTATEGEYQRALMNVDRILKLEKLEKELNSISPGSSVKSKKWIVPSVFIVCTMLVVIFFLNRNTAPIKPEIPRDHTLRWTFESSFINPYIKLDDLPPDCNYPCYKYQGKWKLDKAYKLPIFLERNGYHYLATEVDMYARCLMEKSDKGDIVEGYEYQRHEIWYDRREWPMDSFLTSDKIRNSYYQNLDFNATGDFVKLANIHTFFRSEFGLTDSVIHRSGKVIGRDLELLSKDILLSYFGNEEKVEEVEKEVEKIMRNRIRDFSVPITCMDAPLIDKDVAQIQDGDIMSFRCALTTSRMTIDYVKTYQLTDQYIKNDCVNR